MRVFIKNKLISLRGSSNVLDENGNIIYKVQGKVISPTRKKFIKDLEGNTLYTVRNRWFNWFIHSAFIYDSNKKRIAKVKDKFFNIHKEFFVKGLEDEIVTKGNFFSLSTEIFRNGESIGTIRKDITFFEDSFCLEADEKDIPFLIAFVIAIDNILDNAED